MKSKLIVSMFFLFSFSCSDGHDVLFNNGVCVGYSPDTVYVLPYAPGLSFNVSQANCTQFSHSGSAQRFAYDIETVIGTEVTASRAGRVIDIQTYGNDGYGNFENTISIEHSDGTVMEYVHLSSGSERVSVGEGVVQGQIIALAGSSGTNYPHTHVVLYKNSGKKDSLPLTFRNTRSHPNGLSKGQSYLSEDYVSSDQ